MNNQKPALLGPIVSVLGVLSLIILMLVLGALQIVGVVHIDFAWWMVMVLMFPTILVVGAYISSLGARRNAKRERAAYEREAEQRGANSAARREHGF